MIDSLHRKRESFGFQKDALGNFEAPFSRRRWDASLYRPVVNDRLCQKIPDWLQKVNWPQGKTFAACLTHDVDTVYDHGRMELLRTIHSHLRNSKRPGEFLRHSASLVGLRHQPQKTDFFAPWLEEEKKYGFHSTFYFFPTRVTQRSPRDCTYRWDDPVVYQGHEISVRDLMREIHRRGWEVGLHGSIHSSTDRQLLGEQKEDLEEALGHRIHTTRQHNLCFNVRITPLLHENVGFQCDTTLGFNRDVGFRSGIAYPYRLFNFNEEQESGVFEIPLVLHDGALLREDNLGLNEDMAFEVCCQLIDRVAVTKGVITLLWHPNSIVNKGWFSLYSRLLHYIHTKNGWGASTKMIYDWWVGQGLDAVLDAGLKQLKEE